MHRSIRKQRHPGRARRDVQDHIIERAGAYLDVVGAFGEVDADRALDGGGHARCDRLRRLAGADAQVRRLVGSGAAGTKVRDARRGGVAEHGTAGAIADPAEEHVVGCVEPHHRAELGQETAGGRLGDQASTAGDDHGTRASERVLERGELQVAEVRFAVRCDDRRRRASRARRNLAVKVDGRPPELFRDQGGDCALARSRQADQGDTANRAHRSRLTARRWAAAARRISPRLSPPNFSIAAAARTHASIASATTAPAGTTQMSLRS